MTDWFEWNGKKCTEFGIHVSEHPPITLPAERSAFTNVPGRSGSLTVEDMAFTTGDACVTGGTLTVSQLMDCTNLVCRGGAVTITEGWGFSGDGHQAVTPTVLLTGGTLDANVWMPETIEYQLWSGTITVPGVRHWPNTHLLGDDVTIIDPLDDGKTN